MKAFGIANLAMIPVRRDKSERSELFSQLLFGELYEILDDEGKWLRIRLSHDGGEGWILREAYYPVDKAYAQRYMQSEQLFLDAPFGLICSSRDESVQLISMGSVLPFYNAYTRSLSLGEDSYVLMGDSRESGVNNVRDLLLNYALMFHNTPYVYGGRTPYGIDDAGLIQLVYRLIGVSLPRTVEKQAEQGESLSFLEEALPGDLLFFGDAGGGVTHVGLLWKAGYIIHVSGYVRIDRVDHHGVFNEEYRRYTHGLKLIRRYL